jgi:hypothetical protein
LMSVALYSLSCNFPFTSGRWMAIMRKVIS